MRETDHEVSPTDQALSGDLPVPPTHLQVPLTEEKLSVGKRSVEAGQVHLHKVVHTEQREIPVDLQQERVQIERVEPRATSIPDDAFQVSEIEVPIMREEPVVARKARVTGEVRVSKTMHSETRSVEGQLRREEVEIDQGSVDAYVHTPEERV